MIGVFVYHLMKWKINTWGVGAFYQTEGSSVRTPMSTVGPLSRIIKLS